jgi:hypothetical protein
MYDDSGKSNSFRGKIDGRDILGKLINPSTIRFCPKLKIPAIEKSKPKNIISFLLGEKRVSLATYDRLKPKDTIVAMPSPIPAESKLPLVIIGPLTANSNTADKAAGIKTLAWSNEGASRKDHNASPMATTARP